MNGLTKWPRRLGMVLGIAAALLGPISVASADDLKPLEPGERAYGLTLGEWGAAYWQWIESLPKSSNPNLRSTGGGTLCGVGQRMPVWFLPIRFGETTGTWTCVVPAGQALLFSPITVVNHDFPGNTSEEALFQGIEDGQDLDRTTLEVSVDGVPIPNPRRYRARTPLFNVIYPPGNIWDKAVTGDVGLRAAAVADGHWILLPPLPVGEHLIHARSETPRRDGSLLKKDYTYHLRIREPNDP